MKTKAKNRVPLWKRDGFATEIHFKAAKRGKVLRSILQNKEDNKNHPEYITALVVERVGLVKA